MNKKILLKKIWLDYRHKIITVEQWTTSSGLWFKDDRISYENHNNYNLMHGT